MTNIGFLGTGNMGMAIIKGIYTNMICKDININAYSRSINLLAYDKDTEKLNTLKKYNVTICSDENDLVTKSDFIFLAVKPQVLGEILEIVKGSITEEKVLVSICAGISADFIKNATIPNAKVVLVMPNTPLLLGEGASSLAKVEPTTDKEFSIVKDILLSCGKAEVVPENKMKEIIAINGSSPAFTYLFAKGFIEYAKSVDIDEEVAKSLFAQTLIGSAKMITDSGYTIDELIKMVSSPGGTTLKGLDEFYNADLLSIINKACESCTKRAYELSK